MPTKSQPTKKTFKLTCKKGANESKSIVIEILEGLTFDDLCIIAEKEFNIPKNRQRYKYAYPSKILKMTDTQELKVKYIIMILMEILF